MKKNHSELSVINRYNVPLSEGLSQKQVDERNLMKLTNADKSKASKSYLEIIFKNLFTFFNILCILVAVVLIIFGQIGQCFFMIIITANLVIGIVQEIRSKIMVERLSILSAPTATVIRGGEKQSIPVSNIVLDDIIEYASGKQIASDGEIKSGSITVNESLLTGESTDVKKNVGDRVFAGSFVTGGTALARCDRVGKDNYISELAARAKKLKSTASPILKTLNSIIKTIGFAIIPIAVLVFVKNYFFTAVSQGDLSLAVQRTAGAVIGLIPSGMFLLTSMALAVGVIKLAMNKTLVQDLYCIEMLARCNVLCLDKTGTITDGTMRVSKVEALQECNVGEIIGSMLAATGDNNSTAQALINYFGAEEALHASDFCPFSSTTKLSAVTFDNGVTYVLGAAEFVMNELPKSVTEKILAYSMEGMRVVLLAKTDEAIHDETAPKGTTPVAVIAIEDHIREEAEATIGWFKENNVQIKIISGDNPVTVSHIAKRVGVENAEKFISLDGMADEEVIAVATEYTVFGRVSPDQKALLVCAMKNSGLNVAMTGDGVNDILAFKEADCSVAMANGSDAAKNVASLVLMDSNFANMPKVVAEGRRVVNNIQQSASVYLMKTLFVFLTILITLGSYPFNTKQLMLLEFFVIGVPTFFLALQPNDKLITGNFMVMLLKRAIPSGLVLILNFAAMWIAGGVTHSSPETIKTMQVLAISFSGLVMLALICFPYNIFRLALVSVMLVCSLLAMFLLPAYLELCPLELWQYLAVALAVAVSFPLGALFHHLSGCIKIKPSIRTKLIRRKK